MGSQLRRKNPGVRLRLTSRGWALCGFGTVGVVVAALIGRSEVLTGSAVLVCAPLIALAVLAVARPRLAVHRTLASDVVSVGESVVETLQIHNIADRPSAAATWRETVTGGLRPPLSDELPSLDQRRLGESFGPDCAARRVELRALRRGAATIGPIAVFRPDPFGLASAEYHLGPMHSLLVTPRVIELPEGLIDFRSAEGDDAGLRGTPAPSPDELIARPYQPGDSLRRVIWRATAKQDALMVRQEERRNTPRALVYFDARGPDRVGAADGFDRVFEAAVELVASVSIGLLDQNFDLRLLDNGKRPEGAANSENRSIDWSEQYGSAASVDAAMLRYRLLSDLAVIAPAAPRDDDRLDELAAAISGTASGVPLVAVIGGDDRATAERLGSLRRLVEPAFAFVFETGVGDRGADSPASESARPHGAGTSAAILDAAGWACVSIEAGEPLGASWTRAMSAGTSRIRDRNG